MGKKRKPNKKEGYSVYKHTNKINGKVYIGITSMLPEKRWGNNGDGYKKSPIFSKAIDKYGWDNFKHEILYKNLNCKTAQKYEIELIEKYNSTNGDYGYNIQRGGNLSNKGIKLQKETCNKMSESRTENKNPFYGKTHSQETRDKISASRTGKCCGENHPMFNKHQSEEPKLKMSKSKKEKYSNIEERKKLWCNKKVYCVELDKVYDSLAIAEEETGAMNIERASKDKTRKLTSGKDKYCNMLHWIYYDEYINMSREEIEYIKHIPTYADLQKVICLNTLEIFSNTIEASQWCGLTTKASIANNCKNRNRFVGKHPETGEELHWMRYVEYIENSKKNGSEI